MWSCATLFEHSLLLLLRRDEGQRDGAISSGYFRLVANPSVMFQLVLRKAMKEMHNSFISQGHPRSGMVEE